MKLVVLDPDLATFSGHNFNYLEGIAREARARGIETRIFAYRGIEPAVADAIGAVGHFTTLGRAVLNDIPGDAEVGAAWTHVALNAVFHRDLVPLTAELGPETLVFVPAATSRQILGLAQWLSLIAGPSLPTLVCLLRYDLDAYAGEGPRLKAPALVLSTTARPAVFCCETVENAEAHRATLGLDFATLPLPFTMPSSEHRPPPTDRPVVGYFGDARYMKGFHLLPRLCELARVGDRSYRLAIQTFDTGESLSATGQIAEVRRFAAAGSDTELIEGALDPSAYRRLLDAADIVCLPYLASAYRVASSAVFCEALSASRVVVVPEDTWMSASVRRLGGNPVAFREWTPEAVDAAIRHAIADLPARAAEARCLARAWDAENGAKAVVDRLVAWHRRG